MFGYFLNNFEVVRDFQHRGLAELEEIVKFRTFAGFIYRIGYNYSHLCWECLWKPDISRYKILSTGIHKPIDSLKYENYLRVVIDLIFDILIGQSQPIVEELPEFFLHELDLLLYIEDFLEKEL